MRQNRTKSFAKTFAPGTDLSDVMEFSMKNIETEWKDAASPFAGIKHKYVITVTKIIDKCEKCGKELIGSFNGPVCPKCEKEKLTA